jgi:FlaA1/EpsC-like NDP-sugar epimerase
MGSRGSVIPFFQSLEPGTPVPITDSRMTRFMISLEEGVQLVWQALEDMKGGEIYVKKIPSMKVTDIAATLHPGRDLETVGIRPGEKLHEQMIGVEDSLTTYEYLDYYKILPTINTWAKDSDLIGSGKLVNEGFTYTSENNPVWMSNEALSEWLRANRQ